MDGNGDARKVKYLEGADDKDRNAGIEEERFHVRLVLYQNFRNIARNDFVVTMKAINDAIRPVVDV